MIPIRDEIRARRVPYINYILIAINVIVFILEYTAGSQMEAIVSEFALVPAQLTAGLDPGDFRSILTSMFLHAGWAHLLGNMLYLWIFGDNVEDRLGHFWYLVFYLAGGFVAALAHWAINPASIIPTVGASGAIAAVLGAYLVMYPRARVYTFIPIGFFIRLRLLPASVVLILWFILQLFSGVLTIGLGDVGGTAFWAHIGGFVFGVLVGWLASRRRASGPVRYWTASEGY
ncbi:MAG: rhomboid family intramembrane serine protease [Chloroflexi bacterium]|jgi:membrane associated rhomboid family serine protease|nr:rhomboid family intramembrane serine protease [Anaerolineaceae bacterium]NLI44717.1 rhomboid family intramembrane serine protease [Chloroflexota bacterium]HOE34966.1 rhomboid family intramembrane serine protease [Anaerolineaceae bacterium]HOT25505.1 rhomboid family intramembrane serine protease [Anaerolineaceae bacterium]HQH58139.1 rhomboid family intramembrane serine protease [Anaerolineaceae bacterium]